MNGGAENKNKNGGGQVLDALKGRKAVVFADGTTGLVLEPTVGDRACIVSDFQTIPLLDALV